ncbi:TRAP transporter substrate-binding protein [Aeoliella sp. ICT_H6.2]|uniref:TRAP transporter substrate-binding protein n=1 Tax=Aeoliella straminimaris TaxID=2954799 RepID=A0A9X2FDL1_9BACT|nr:TRAP transporter substrate-binding protein [Aeoliella straminimaris]MCO6046263.1 TRAP transporter substrate-binding protein [Aeoliella straminimaris]
MSKTVSLLLVGCATCLLLAIAAVAVATGAAMAPADRVELKLGHSLDQNHPVHLAMEFMKERLAEKSSGTMILEIRPNGQLGAETECLSLVQRGVLAMTKTSAAPLENFVPEMAVFGIPFLFEDEAHFWRVLHSDLGNDLLEAGADSGLRGLSYYDAGARSFYTISRPIMTPEDLKGLLIRVQESPTSIAMIESLGGSPTPVDFGDLYTALQQGVVDGAENNPPSFYTNRHYEVCKHLSLDQHTRTPDVLIISQRWWQRLTPQQQQWLAEAAQESAEYERKLWQEKTQEALAGAEERGVTIHHPDLEPFRQSVSSMVESYAGTPTGDLIEKIQAMGGEQ